MSKEKRAKIVLNKHILGVMDKASSSVDQSHLSVFDKIYGRPGDQVRANTELEANDIESQFMRSFAGKSAAPPQLGRQLPIAKPKDRTSQMDAQSIGMSSAKTPKSVIYSKMPAKSGQATKMKITKPSIVRDDSSQRRSYDRKSSLGKYRYSQQKWPYAPFGQQDNREVIDSAMTGGRAATQQMIVRNGKQSPELNRKPSKQSVNSPLGPHYYTI